MAKSIIEHGTIWRIGNGEDERVWKDRWIPCQTSFSMQSPIRNLSNEALVKDLIDPDTKAWNVELVKETFWEEEAKIILSIPLSPTLPRDRRIWRCTSNRDFSVRSAYHMEMELVALSNCSGLGQETKSTAWKICWKLRVPNVAKMFLWKAFNNLLPTKSNMSKKGVTKDNLCPICGLEEETVSHILWDCGSAKDVWGEFTEISESSSSGIGVYPDF